VGSLLKEIVLRASLPPHAAKKFLEWADKDANEEKGKSSGIISTYQLQLKETEEKQTVYLRDISTRLFPRKTTKRKRMNLSKQNHFLIPKLRKFQQTVLSGSNLSKNS